MCRHSAAFPQSRDRHGREGNNLINTCGINFSITVLPIPPTHLPLHTPPPSFIPTLRYANEHVRLAHRPQPSRQIVCCDDERKTVGKNGCPDSSFRLAWRGNVQQLPACNGGQERTRPESHHPQKLEIFSLLVRQYHCSYAVEVSCAVLLAANYNSFLSPSPSYPAPTYSGTCPRFRRVRFFLFMELGGTSVNDKLLVFTTFGLRHEGQEDRSTDRKSWVELVGGIQMKLE